MNRRLVVVVVSLQVAATLAFAGAASTALPRSSISFGDLQDIWQSTGTFSNGTLDRIYALPWAVAGSVTAKYEIAHGQLSLKMYGLPAQSRPIYSQIIRNRFGVESKTVAGCVVTHLQMARWSAHNAAMVKEIHNRFGESSLLGALDEADAEYQELYRQGALPWQLQRREREIQTSTSEKPR